MGGMRAVWINRRQPFDVDKGVNECAVDGVDEFFSSGWAFSATEAADLLIELLIGLVGGNSHHAPATIRRSRAWVHDDEAVVRVAKHREFQPALFIQTRQAVAWCDWVRTRSALHRRHRQRSRQARIIGVGLVVLTGTELEVPPVRKFIRRQRDRAVD